MAQDPRRRQKKLQRKKAKHKKSLAVKRARENFDPFDRLITAPILDCFHAGELWNQGIGYVLISRKLPNGQVAFVSFLVDVWCLGVKDVIREVAFESQYRSNMVDRMRERDTLVPISPAHARKLVEEAVAYARRFGLPPCHDYLRATRIFGDINPAECTETFTFGKDGKPFYSQGPYESPEDCRRIVAALNQHAGPGAFHYLLRLTESQLDPSMMELIGPGSRVIDTEEDELEDDEWEDEEESDDDEREDDDEAEDDDDGDDEPKAEQPRHDVKPPEGDWLPWLKPQDGPNG